LVERFHDGAISVEEQPELEDYLASRVCCRARALAMIMMCSICRVEGERYWHGRSRSGALAGFFHRRRQRWAHHFQFRGTVTEPLTPEGEATARLLKLNLNKRVVERRLLMAVGRYPR
jgi:hypothetical protein